MNGENIMNEQLKQLMKDNQLEIAKINTDSLKVKESVNHPEHYKSLATCDSCGNGIECIDIVEHLNFNIGNVFKYLWRAGKKGSKIEDIYKAQWYLEREIERLEKDVK